MITDAAARIKVELARLSSEDRAELARFLIQSLDEGVDEGVEAAWDAELARRFDEIRSGEAQGDAAETVFARLRARYS